MERPKRKRNRLEDWDYSTPGYYFVTICTKKREHLLGTVCAGADVLIGPHVHLSDIGMCVHQTLSRIPAAVKFVVMPNHIHILFHISAPEGGPMRTKAPTTTQPMHVRYLKRTVTQKLRHSIWQRGYHDHIICNEADYLRIWTYMDQNPVKWREDCYYEEGIL